MSPTLGEPTISPSLPLSLSLSAPIHLHPLSLKKKNKNKNKNKQKNPNTHTHTKTKTKNPKMSSPKFKLTELWFLGSGLSISMFSWKIFLDLMAIHEWKWLNEITEDFPISKHLWISLCCSADHMNLIVGFFLPTLENFSQMKLISVSHVIKIYIRGFFFFLVKGG